jgi:hypothetical protein
LFTIDGGAKWTPLTGNAPTIAFRDLAIQKRENDLVGASFGRGFWILDDYTPLRTVTEQQLQQPASLFPVRDAWWYLPRLTLGDFRENGKAYQGDAYFVAPNPPFGAVFTYYLRDEIRTTKGQRREQEKTLAAAGEDTPYPGWDAILAEEKEEEPAVVLTVRDTDGKVVRRIEGPATAGFHRVAWDLRYAESSPWQPELLGEQYIEIKGPLAAPGSYRVSLATRINGQLNELGQRQDFAVVQMREPGLKGDSPEEVVAFTRELDDLARQVTGASAAISEMLMETGAIKQTLARSQAPESLRATARSLELELLALQEKLSGSPTRDLYNDTAEVSISGRMQTASMGTFRSTYGPTPMIQRQYEIAAESFVEVRTRLQQIKNSELPALRRQLDEAGVPWTPGRGVPAGE